MGKIAGSFTKQKRLADEKLRAVACKECAHTALDVVRSEERRQHQELKIQLRRHRAELTRACATYLHHERLRLVAATECLETTHSQGDDADTALVAVQEAWTCAQKVLCRAELLLQCAACDGSTAAAEETLAVTILTGEATSPDFATEEVKPAEAGAFFAQVAAQGEQTCIDCGLPDADWASVSYGTYLCVDCAGKHRGLGVHISFVRSTTMDIWSQEQLRRMQLGGTPRFREFLEGYPRLRVQPLTPAALSARYGSCAASHYRRLLDARCEGSESHAEPTPPPSMEEGHLPSEAQGVSGSAGSTCGGTLEGAMRDDDEGDGSESTVASMEAERVALEEAYHKHKRQMLLQASPISSLPTSPSSNASAAEEVASLSVAAQPSANPHLLESAVAFVADMSPPAASG